jgi:spoIIIJ-associated protein
MQPIEIEGRTVAEAVDAALRQNGLRREQVEVTVIEEGSTGFMGIGAKPARVRLSEKRWGEGPVPVDAPKAAPRRAAPAPAPRPAPRNEGLRTAPKGEQRRESKPEPRPAAPAPVAKEAPRPAPAPRPEPKREPRPEPRHEPRREPRRESRPEVRHESRPSRRDEAYKPLTPEQTVEACAKAQALVAELLKLMTIAAPTVTAAWDKDMERVKIVVESQEANLLVGRDGRVLESLQFLATLMMSRGAETPVAVQVDALSYWEKREQAILDEARKGIAAVMVDGRPYRLEPMDASMRRLIHRTFSTHPDITTGSEGEGPWRKLVIRPRKG